jgi:small subunit ribosomal protein S13
MAQKPKDIETREAEKKAEEKKKERPAPAKKKQIEGVRGIVRVAETDLDGTRKLGISLVKIRGIGQGLAAALPRVTGLDANELLGRMTEEQIVKLEAAIRDPASLGIPAHMINRRVDPVDGTTKHVVSSNLTIAKKNDIDSMKKMHSYKGIRHELGLPVRGQRTRSSFRTGMTAGVSRAKVTAAAPAGAPAPAAGKAAATTPAAPGAATAPSAKPSAAGGPPAAAAPKKEERKK